MRSCKIEKARYFPFLERSPPSLRPSIAHPDAAWYRYLPLSSIAPPRRKTKCDYANRDNVITVYVNYGAGTRRRGYRFPALSNDAAARRLFTYDVHSRLAFDSHAARRGSYKIARVPIGRLQDRFNERFLKKKKKNTRRERATEKERVRMEIRVSYDRFSTVESAYIYSPSRFGTSSDRGEANRESGGGGVRENRRKLSARRTLRFL